MTQTIQPENAIGGVIVLVLGFLSVMVKYCNPMVD